jgi:HTH-type transcriptional regulator / antitoxin HipB
MAVTESNLKDVIRQHRKLSGLSQAGLAKLAGVGKTAVFDLEHGKETIQLDTLKKVLGVLNIQLELNSPFIERLAKLTARDPLL